MSLIYPICFIVGGIFVLFSALGGLEGTETGSGAELDGGFETDVDFATGSTSSDDAALSPVRRRRRRLWLPLFSLRFWTFGSCCFGLAGLLLTTAQNVVNLGLSAFGIAVLSGGIGLACGSLVAGIVRTLQQRRADSLVRANDILGLPGTVTLPFGCDRKGKVTINVRGTTIDFVALTDDPKGFKQGEQVFVVEMKGNQLWVVSEELLQRRRFRAGR